VVLRNELVVEKKDIYCVKISEKAFKKNREGREIWELCTRVYLPERGWKRYPKTQREISLLSPVFFQRRYGLRVYYS